MTHHGGANRFKIGNSGVASGKDAALRETIGNNGLPNGPLDGIGR
jgi:hypothetical protein